MRITFDIGEKTVNATDYAESAELSGAYNQAARTLTVSLSSDCPYINSLALMSAVKLYEGDALLFVGYIFARSRSAEAKTVEYRCLDAGIYLKRNKATYQFSGTAPEEIVRVIAADFGLTLGEAARTAQSVTAIYKDRDLYSIIMDAYTRAAQETGKKYMLQVREGRLYVTEKGVRNYITLTDTRDITGAKYTESAEDVITQVAMYNRDGALCGTVKDDSLLQVYGIFRDAVHEQTDKSLQQLAQKKLEEGKVKRTAEIDNLGHAYLITGDAVCVRETATGIIGKFYIDGDVHRWQHGIYTNRLSLSFENIMDERDVRTYQTQGSAAGSGSAADMSGVYGFPGGIYAAYDGTATQGGAAMVEIAKSQLGNSGSDYIYWYNGSRHYVAWCAIFVSWCAMKAGFLDTKVPKFSLCDTGRDWFVSRRQWLAGGKTPKVGDLIFFNRDGGSLDHVGIVRGVSGSMVLTIEGNSSKKVRERAYEISDWTIAGYGVVT